MKYRAKHRPRRQSPRSKKLRGRGKLLKSASAGLLGIGLSSGAAQAFEVDEATSPFVSGGDFSDAFPGDLLPNGVTSVVGNVGFNGVDDDVDYFQLTGLQPGSLVGITPTLDDDFGYSLDILDSAGNSVGTAQPSGEFTADVPGDGVIVGFQYNTENAANNYSLAINATYVPEPAAGVLAALGAAGLLGLTQRKRD